MGTVNLTQSLTQHILGRIRAHYDPKIIARRKEVTDFAGFPEMIYRAVVSHEHEALANKLLATGLIITGQTIYVRYKQSRIEVYLSSPRPLPAAYQSSYNSPPVELPPELAKTYDTMLADCEAITKERDALLQSIEKLMNSCSNLKQLLKVWPSALEFCPPDAVARHNKPDPVKTKFDPKAVELSDAAKLSLVKVRVT